MSSNIANLFNPPPERDLSVEETEDCLPCQVMATAFSIGFGSYLASGKPFQYGEIEKRKGITVEEFAKLNPKWWVNTIKSFGTVLIVFGIYRGTEGWLWNQQKRYKS